MDIIDIFLGCALGFGAYKGIKNGLFVELASLISFFVGVFMAIKFSSVVAIMIWQRLILQRNILSTI